MSTLAVAAGLVLLVLVCWFICAKIEPAIRRQLAKVFSDVGRRPKMQPRLPIASPGLRPLPVRVRVDVTRR